MSLYSQNGRSKIFQSAVLEQSIKRLRNSDQKKVQVSKAEVPELPPRFEEDYPANEMQSEGAKASYRDDRKEDSVHVIEYEDYWNIHIDDHNPRFDDQKVPHLVNDAPKAAVGLIAAAAVVYWAYS